MAHPKEERKKLRNYRDVTATTRSRREASQRGGTFRAWAPIFPGRKQYFNLVLFSPSLVLLLLLILQRFRVDFITRRRVV